MYEQATGQSGGTRKAIGLLVGGNAGFTVIVAIVIAIGDPVSSGEMNLGGLVFFPGGPAAAVLGAIAGGTVGVMSLSQTKGSRQRRWQS